MHSDREEPGKSLEQSTAPQNAREEVTGSVFPVSSRSLEALVHSLHCMGDRAAEAGLHGNAGIARRAAGLIDNVQKAVTRLLPEGQGVRHASVEVDLAVVSLQARESGRIMAILTNPAGGGWWSLPVDELVPIYDIVAYSGMWQQLARDTSFSDFGKDGIYREGGPDPLRSLEPRSFGEVVDEREPSDANGLHLSGRRDDRKWGVYDDSFLGTRPTPEEVDRWKLPESGKVHHFGVDMASPDSDETVITTVHHLSVDPDQEVHVYHPAFGQAAEMIGAPIEQREDALPVRFLFGLLLVVIVIALLLMATR